MTVPSSSWSFVLPLPLLAFSAHNLSRSKKDSAGQGTGGGSRRENTGEVTAWLLSRPPPRNPQSCSCMHRPGKIVLIYFHFLECLLGSWFRHAVLSLRGWFGSIHTPSWFFPRWVGLVACLSEIWGSFYAILGWRCIILVLDSTLGLLTLATVLFAFPRKFKLSCRCFRKVEWMEIGLPFCRICWHEAKFCVSCDDFWRLTVTWKQMLVHMDCVWLGLCSVWLGKFQEKCRHLREFWGWNFGPSILH